MTGAEDLSEGVEAHVGAAAIAMLALVQVCARVTILAQPRACRKVFRIL